MWVSHVPRCGVTECRFRGDWRQLACSSGPDVATPGRAVFTVAEFIDTSNCTTTTSQKPLSGSSKRDHVIHDSTARLVDRRRRRKFGGGGGGGKPEVAKGNADAEDDEHAQSTMKYLPVELRPHADRRLSTSGGNAAALVALALCAAMLALLGGLLLCRAGVRRSRDDGGGRIQGQCRQKRDLFVVYADEDEAWVTGTLLDIIFTRHPCYDVILQQHLQQQQQQVRHSAHAHKWNSYEQLMFGSVIDHSTVRLKLTLTMLSQRWKQDFLRPRPRLCRCPRGALTQSPWPQGQCTTSLFCPL